MKRDKIMSYFCSKMMAVVVDQVPQEVDSKREMCVQKIKWGLILELTSLRSEGSRTGLWRSWVEIQSQQRPQLISQDALGFGIPTLTGFLMQADPPPGVLNLVRGTFLHKEQSLRFYHLDFASHKFISFYFHFCSIGLGYHCFFSGFFNGLLTTHFPVRTTVFSN